MGPSPVGPRRAAGATGAVSAAGGVVDVDVMATAASAATAATCAEAAAGAMRAWSAAYDVERHGDVLVVTLSSTPFPSAPEGFRSQASAYVFTGQDLPSTQVEMRAQ